MELDEALADGLDAGRLARGRELEADGAVTDLEAGRAAGVPVITASVTDGDQTWQIYARVEDGRVEGDCGCAEAWNCEHVAAAVVAAETAGRENAPEASAENAGDRHPSAPGTTHKLIYLLDLDDDSREVMACALRVPAGPVEPDTVATPFAAARIRQAEQPGYIQPTDRTILRNLDSRCPLRDGVWHTLPADCDDVLEHLLASGRTRWESIHKAPVSRGPDRAATPYWKFYADGSQRLAFEDRDQWQQLPLVPPWYLDRETPAIGRLDAGLPPDALDTLTGLSPLAADQAPAARDEIEGTGSGLPLPAVPELITVESGPPEPVLVLEADEGPAGARARLFFDYEGHRFPAGFEGEFLLDSASDSPPRVLCIRRGAETEQEFLDRLQELDLRASGQGSAADGSDGQALDLTPARGQPAERVWTRLAREIPALEAGGWRVEMAPDYPWHPARVDEWTLSARPGESGDWFDLEFSVTADGQTRSLLPLLEEWIDHYADPERLAMLDELPDDRDIPLRLDEHNLLFMPAERLKRVLRLLVELFDGAPPTDRTPRLAAARAGLLGHQFSRHWQFEAPDRLERLAERLAGFEGVEPTRPPETLHAELRGYQQAGLDWLQFLRNFELGGILADDMGLGKTIQTLAHLLVEKESGRMDQPSLVVAPTSLMFNWRAEARRFAPELRVLMAHGPRRKLDFHRLGDADLVLTTYPLIHRDMAVLGRQSWHLLILDEAQQIKNPGTRAARAVRELRARHRLCLTGTPMENHLGELWALMDFLMPGLLGTQTAFRRHFRNPIERHGDARARERLSRRLRPFFLRRTKSEVAPELPDKTEIQRGVALNDAQQTLYDSVRLSMQARVRKALAERGLEGSRIVVLDALLKLRQVCCHPQLLRNIDHGNAGSAKLDLLMDLLPSMVEEGRRVLLFSQFTSMLAIIQEALDESGLKYVTLTGQTRDRAAPVEAFQAGRVPVFLVSLKAGGAGLNLTAADTVIHYDPWWNPAVEDQATDRAHRIGQDQKVMVYRLVTEGTVEEKILKMQEEKRELLDGLFGSGGGSGMLDSRDLEVLFEPA